MQIRPIALLAVLVLALAPHAARAQTTIPGTPTGRTVTLTFHGTVTNAWGDVQILQPDGSLAPYTGPLPNLPYQNGQDVTITFAANVPTAADIAAGKYIGQIAADGRYEITLQNLNPALTTTSNATQASGNIGAMPFTPIAWPGNGTVSGSFTGMTIGYDASTDTYAVIAPTTVPYNFQAQDYPGAKVIYDATTGMIVSCNGDPACGPNVDGKLVLTTLYGGGDASHLATRQTIFGASGFGVGGWQSFIDGAWTLIDSGSGATPVPEPGMLGMFGAAVLVPVARRRRAASAQAKRAGA